MSHGGTTVLIVGLIALVVVVPLATAVADDSVVVVQARPRTAPANPVARISRRTVHRAISMPGTGRPGRAESQRTP
jgi:hypothetical protein